VWVCMLKQLRPPIPVARLDATAHTSNGPR
jgi:hypothetical protein